MNNLPAEVAEDLNNTNVCSFIDLGEYLCGIALEEDVRCIKNTDALHLCQVLH